MIVRPIAVALQDVAADLRQAPAWFAPFCVCLLLWGAVAVWLIHARVAVVPPEIRAAARDPFYSGGPR